MRTYALHREAEAELRAATEWYRSRSATAALGFVDAIGHALHAISETPEAWPRRAARADIRAFVLARYPFAVVYRVTPQPGPLRVLAIAHAHRRPDYWLRRR